MKKEKPLKARALLLVSLLMLSFLSASIYLMAPVKAKVFDMDLPNVNLGALDLKIIGKYDLHIEDLNLSGFFKVGNDTVNYYMDIESADVYYEAGVNGTELHYLRYKIFYEGLNFTIKSESFSLSIDYIQFSAEGDLLISLVGKDTFNVAVYEMVPRTEIYRCVWPGVEILRKIGGTRS